MTLLAESSGLKTKNDLLVKQNESLTKEKGELQKQVEFLAQAKKEVELKSRGINPDILEIKTLSVESSWQISSIKYEIKKVYLAPDIADLGTDRDQPDLINKNFLMVEVNISDLRTGGGEQVVPASDYLNLRKGGLDSKPFTQDYLSLLPGVSSVMYSGFAVDKSDTKFELRSGYLTNADVLSLDFESTGSAKLNGVFLLTKGFATEYRE